ncbi:MAG: sce7726 family protein [Clostridiales bacterium]|nr:sce7726 family protein [Clostridiales bacterium]MBE6046696.1 sce7726 family protein [Clostridiales bacterium]
MTATKATAAKNADPAVLKDADIREPLFLYLEERYGKVRFIEEKVTGKARADVVMVLPDKLCGIEIKSDADTYVRLADQVKYYDKYYDENYIVAGSRHAMHVAKHVPEYWGIITVELIKDRVDFYRVREALPNPKAKLKQKLSLLWKSELAHIQAKNGMPKYTNKNKKFIGEKLIEKVPAEVLHEQISEELFERDYTLL